MKTNTTYENRLSSILSRIAAAGLNEITVKEHASLYNELGEAGNLFFGKTALNATSRGLIYNVMDQDLDAVIDNCTMHMISKLDLVLKQEEENRIRYITTMANNLVSTMCRKVKTHNDHNTTLDDVAWGYIPDSADLEDDYVTATANRQAAELTLEALTSCKPLQVAAMLGIEMLESDATPVAQEILDFGFSSTLVRYISQTCEMFGAEPMMFADVIRQAVAMDAEYEDLDVKTLSAKISRAKYTCREAVKKTLSGTMVHELVA